MIELILSVGFALHLLVLFAGFSTLENRLDKIIDEWRRRNNHERNH